MIRLPILILLSALFATSAFAQQWYVFEDFNDPQCLQKWKRANISGSSELIQAPCQTQNPVIEANQAITTKTNFGGQFFLPASSGLVLAFDMLVSDDFTIVNTASEIVNIETTACGINIGVCGNENTPGQICIGTTRTIKNVLLNDKSIPFEQSSQKVKIYYTYSKTADPITIKIF